MSGAEFADDEVSEYDPERHYDRVTSAWKLLLGDAAPLRSLRQRLRRLDVATEALTRRMIDAAALEPGSPRARRGVWLGSPRL